MDKYDGTNKPNVTLRLNESIERCSFAARNNAEDRKEQKVSEKPDAECVRDDVTGADETVVESERSEKEGSRIISFLIRGAVSALILGFLFLPRIFPYKGAEKVTEAAKTIVMSDIVPQKEVGSGKLVDIFRDLLDSDDSSQTEDEEEK